MRKLIKIVLIGGAVLIALIVVIAVASGGGKKTPAPASGGNTATAVATPAASPASASETPAGADQVTFVVTGSDAQVTYGPPGSTSEGTVPMTKTIAVPGHAPVYYAIDAQLQGSGKVTVKIEVNGKTVSSGTATGGYNIASAEISKGFTGHWEDTNSS